MPQEAYTPNILIKYADYYPQFACKCGECRDTCCHGWKITISYPEYFRIDALRADPEFDKRIEALLGREDMPEPDLYAHLNKDKNENCLMLDPDGLCSLHRKYGADILPSVCRLYPRSVKMGS